MTSEFLLSFFNSASFDICIKNGYNAVNKHARNEAIEYITRTITAANVFENEYADDFTGHLILEPKFYFMGIFVAKEYPSREHLVNIFHTNV